jgi:hypothetical protein
MSCQEGDEITVPEGDFTVVEVDGFLITPREIFFKCPFGCKDATSYYERRDKRVGKLPKQTHSISNETRSCFNRVIKKWNHEIPSCESFASGTLLFIYIEESTPRGILLLLLLLLVIIIELATDGVFRWNGQHTRISERLNEERRGQYFYYFLLFSKLSLFFS